MDWITDNVAIGNRVDAHSAQVREEGGFRSVISLDGSMTEDRAFDLGYEDCVVATLNDGPGNNVAQFNSLLQTLLDMVESCAPVLVHCHAGRSRSVTLVAAYLVASQGMTRSEAYRFIGQRREICVSAGLEELVDAVARGQRA
jgi:protein-tyrosine phosphatase